MPDSTITQLPAGTVTLSWVLPADDSAGTATYKVTVSSILALLTDISQFTQGTLPAARLATSGAAAGTYTSVTVDQYGRVTSGSNPSVDWSNLSGVPASFAPASHAHGNISNAGAIGSTSGLPVVTGASGILQAGAWGTSSGQFCQGNDSRLSDSRSPTSHASSHQPNGSDAILPRSLTTTLSGSNNNYDVSGYDIVRVTSTGNVTITGLTANPQAPVLIINENASGGGTITLTHESSSSTAANRVRSQTGSDIVLQPDGGQVWLAYSPVASRWRA